MSIKRYVVFEINGQGTGAGMFAIHDNQDGCQVGKYFYSHDEAEKKANRMNIETHSGPFTQGWMPEEQS